MFNTSAIDTLRAAITGDKAGKSRSRQYAVDRLIKSVAAAGDAEGRKEAVTEAVMAALECETVADAEAALSATITALLSGDAVSQGSEPQEEAVTVEPAPEAPEATDEAPEAPEADEVIKAPQALAAKVAEAAKAAEAALAEKAATKAASKKLTKAPRQTGVWKTVLLGYLTRPEGATVAEIAEGTGWKESTIVGSISRTVRREMGHPVVITTVEGRGKVYGTPQAKAA